MGDGHKTNEIPMLQSGDKIKQKVARDVFAVSPFTMHPMTELLDFGRMLYLKCSLIIK